MNESLHPAAKVKSRSLWTSRFGFIMATAGAAVGLGNIWKFPYMAGNNGGGVFVVLYLVFILFIGIPAMIAELLIGRRGRQNPVNTLAKLSKTIDASPAWQNVGWLGSFTLLMVLSFYSVVAGWSIAYLFYALTGVFVEASPSEIIALWHTLLDSPGLLIGWHTLFMILTMGLVARGVNKGIENASKWMMPGLFLILIFLVLYAGITGNFWEAWRFLFSFKLEDLSTQAVIDALGQAFFSLATGAGAILIYGSYLPKKTDVVETVFIIAFLDVLVALLAGLAIFPLVFSHGLSPESGPGLMFQVLPIVFSHMTGSQFIGTGFFVLLLFAAWTSSISMGEPLVALLNERWRISRGRSALYVGLIAWSFGLASVFSFNLWQDFKIGGRIGLFQILTDLPTNILLPVGAFLFCIFAGWVLPERDIRDEFDVKSPFVYAVWLTCVRYIAPLGILLVLLANLFGDSLLVN